MATNDESYSGDSYSERLRVAQGLYKHESTPMSYDHDAFDSMAVVNSELWNDGEEDETGLTMDDLLPNGTAGLSKDTLEPIFLRAAQTGVLKAVKEIHKHCGAEILQTTDKDMYTALHRASYNGHVPVVEYLLHEGANIDARTIDGWQPLHSACRWNKVRAASLLLQNGAKINSQTYGGQTPLHLAAINDRARDTLELLLRNKDLDPEIKTGQGDTARVLAQRNGKFGFLFEMIEESCDHRKFLKSYTLRNVTAD